MSHLFQQGSEDDGEHERGVHGGVGEGRDEGVGFSGVRQVGVESVGFGPPARRRTRVKYPFDELNARREPVGFYATDNASMSSEEFRVACIKLLRNAELAQELESRQLAFMEAMFVAYVLNSASTLAPDRAGFGLVGGLREYNFYRDVVDVLGASTRRFFRAAADEIYLLLKRLCGAVHLGTLSERQEEMVRALKVKAEARGLGRIPWCAFDAADFISTDIMPSGERLQVKVAKAAVTASTPNAADAMFVDRNVQAGVGDASVRSGDMRKVVSAPPRGGGGFTV